MGGNRLSRRDIRTFRRTRICDSLIPTGFGYFRPTRRRILLPPRAIETGPQAVPAAHRRGFGGGWLALAPALTLALLLVPLVAGLAGTLLPAFGVLPALGGDRFSLDPWRRLFAAPGLAHMIAITVWVGTGATVAALLLAVAVRAAWQGARARRLVRGLALPVLGLPHAAFAIGFGFLAAPSGWLVRLLSPWLTGWHRPPDLALVQDPWGLALAVALAVKEAPFLLLMLAHAEEQVAAERLLLAARTMGYGPVAAWLRLVLPQIHARVRLPIYAVLAYGLSVADMAIVLGPTAPPTLPVRILQWFAAPDLSMRFQAAACAVLQGLIVLAMVALWRGGERLAGMAARPWLSAGGRGGRGRAVRGAGAVLGLAGAAVAAGAVVALALWSLAAAWPFPAPLPTGWTLAAWCGAWGDLAGPTVVTVAAALLSAAIATVLAVACLENERRIRRPSGAGALWLIYLPLLVPQIAFLFGFQVVLATAGLDGTFTALVWAHCLFVVPYVFLAVSEAYRRLDERYGRSARCLGAGPLRVFLRVTLPLLLRPILMAAAIGVAVSVAQYLATIFAGAGRIDTLATDAVALATGGDRRLVGAYAFLQAALPFAAFALAALAPVRGTRGEA